MKALVIGAGIGGLSAAVALKNAGITCEVFEAVKEIKPVGAAISIWPNGVKCMKTSAWARSSKPTAARCTF